MAHPWTDESRPVYPGTVKEGYLVKSPPLGGRGVKHWRQRWCVFTSTGNEPPCLLYFTDRQAVLTGRMPIKRVTLESCFKVERALKHSSRPHVFAVHLPERVFYFSAVTHDEMLSWVDALSAHLQLEPQEPPSPSPHSTPQVAIGARTLPRTQAPPTPECHDTPEYECRDRSHSNPQPYPRKRDQPLPALPTEITTDAPPPLPHRPELKYSKSSYPPL